MSQLKHELSLVLDLLEQAAASLHFRLAVRNDSQVNLLLPHPPITGLVFRNIDTGQNCKWYTRILAHTSWSGITLRPGKSQVVEYRARPCSIEPPTNDRSDYYRWCVELPTGDYRVMFQFGVGTDYFCGDSHYRYKDLQREAATVDAVAWTGNQTSNTLTLSWSA